MRTHVIIITDTRIFDYILEYKNLFDFEKQSSIFYNIS
jgi:hypothetical protein